MAESIRFPEIRCSRPPAHVLWSVEGKGILLLNQHSGDVLRLDYPLAALWDLMHKNYPPDKLIDMLSIIAAMDTGQTERLVAETLNAWAQAGFLIKNAENG
jgi:hypothetical protein